MDLQAESDGVYLYSQYSESWAGELQVQAHIWGHVSHLKKRVGGVYERGNFTFR